jgi:NDP-sugar pyrophosphorylase family protein
MQAVILAAGKGSRLRPLTTSRTKAMLPILGKPIVERVINNLAACGLWDFILVISPEDREIKEYLQHESVLDIKLRFVHQPKRLGSADALKQAAPLLEEDFILSACDNLVSEEDVQRLISRWSQHGDFQALLSLLRIPMTDTWKTGIVTLENDQVTSIIEKPSPDQAPTNISSLPLYCFSPRVLDYLPKITLSPRGEYELQDAIQMMIAEGERINGLFLQSRLTLTTPEDLLELNLHFLKNEAKDCQIDAQETGPGTTFEQPVYIERGVEIGFGCTIGPNVYIEKDVRVGDNVRLQNVVVLRQAILPDGVELQDQVVT